MADWTKTVQLDGSADYDLIMEVDLLDQSTSGNWSKVKITGKAKDPGGWGSWGYYSTNWSAKAGSTSSGSLGSFDFRGGAGKTITIGSVTKTISHSSDGTKTLTMEFTWDSQHGSVGKATASRSITLPAIPRATQPSVSGAVNAGSSLTISMPRASSSFDHTLTYKFGGASGTIGSDLGTSRSWTVPMSLLNEIPDATSGTGTITCKTYNGSTLIGTKTVSFTVKAASTVKPTFSAITHSETVSAVSTNVGAYVQGLSKLALGVAGAAGTYGSTIVERRFAIGTQVLVGTSPTTSEITVSGAVTLTATVTDSRGRTYSDSVELTVLPYASPQISSIQVRRALSNGTPAGDGTYVRVDLGAEVQSLINGTQKNTLTYKVETRATGGSWTERVNTTHSGVTFASALTVGSGQLSIAQSYEVRVTVTDKFGQVLVLRPIATSKVPLAVAEDGIGVGKVWERGALDVAGNAYIDGPLEADSLEVTGTAEVETLVSNGVATLNDVVIAGDVTHPLFDDTDWVTSGLSISTGADFSLSSYMLRKIGNYVFGTVSLAWTSSFGVTVPANNNITDRNGVIVMPAGWRSDAPGDLFSHVDRSGVATWFSRVRGTSDPGRIDLTHGVNGQSFNQGDILVFAIGYTAY